MANYKVFQDIQLSIVVEADSAEEAVEAALALWPDDADWTDKGRDTWAEETDEEAQEHV